MKKFLERLKKCNAGTIMGIVFTLYAAGYLIASLKYPYTNKFGMGPGFFPRWVAVLAVIAGIAYILVSVKKDKFIVEDVFPQKKELLNVLTVVLAIFIFILTVNYLGYLIASTLLMFAIFIRSYKWPKALLYALLTSLIVFAIFKIGFKVPVPVNRFGF